MQKAIYLYEGVAPIIRKGKSRLYQQIGAAWRHPQGAQAVVRVSENSSQALVVVHTFAAPLPPEITVTLPEGEWQVAGVFPGTSLLRQFNANRLSISPLANLKGWF